MADFQLMFTGGADDDIGSRSQFSKQMIARTVSAFEEFQSLRLSKMAISLSGRSETCGDSQFSARSSQLSVLSLCTSSFLFSSLVCAFLANVSARAGASE